MPLLEASAGAPTCADCQTTMRKRGDRWECINPWCGRDEVSEA